MEGAASTTGEAMAEGATSTEGKDVVEGVTSMAGDAVAESVASTAGEALSEHITATVDEAVAQGLVSTAGKAVMVLSLFSPVSKSASQSDVASSVMSPGVSPSASFVVVEGCSAAVISTSFVASGNGMAH